MHRFLYWWLAIVAFMLLHLGVAGLASYIATVATHESNPWIGASVMVLFVSALIASGMAWVFGPTPPWFRKLVTRLSDQ
jgi:hypothetical protein